MMMNREHMNFSIPSRLDALSRVERIVEKIASQMELSKDQHDNLAIAVTRRWATPSYTETGKIPPKWSG